MTAEVLKPWDGRAGRWQYRDAADRQLLIASDGSIYARDYHGYIYIWCAAARLAQHLRDLCRRSDAVIDVSEQTARALRVTADALYNMVGR